MKKLVLLICLTPLMAHMCNKESTNCHLTVLFKNNSGKKIMFAYKYGTMDNKCFLSGWTEEAGGEIKLKKRYCYEAELKDGRLLEFYIADPTSFAELKVDCDSIDNKYPILKHYQLSAQNLSDLDWKVIYE